MGCYDTVNIQCPHCDQINKIQVKTGPCRLKTYAANAVPVDVAAGLVGYTFGCKHCATQFKVETRTPEVRLYTRVDSGGEEDDED